MAEKVNKLKQAHDALIQDVIEQMAQGNLPWRKPWNLKRTDIVVATLSFYQ